MQAVNAAKVTREILIKKQYWEATVTKKYFTSPHFRTLQTAANWVFEWTQDPNTLININSSIVLKNGTLAWDKAKGKCPFMNGALTFKPDVLANRLDNKATNLVWDPLANPSLNPNKSAEKSANTRYSNGFKDILEQHFIS